MPGGRPRKPAEVKILEGTFRRDRDGGSAPVDGKPKPPDYLEGEALAYWRSIVPSMIDRGLVGASDSGQLGLLCWFHAEALHFIDDIRANRAAKINTAPGVYVQLGICADKYDRIAAKFGLTPSDRAKLRLDPTPKKSAVASRKRS